MSEEPISVSYEAYLYGTKIPFRYMVSLAVDGIHTGIKAIVWGRARANECMQHMIDHGNELLNQYGLATELAAEIYAKRREEAMTKVQVGDRVRLLVDIGTYKKGRVCKVVEVDDEPTFYVSRGANAWQDDRYPIKVIPVQMATDRVALGPKDCIPLMRGEFGPLDTEIDDD
jgi:hypothetical protein